MSNTLLDSFTPRHSIGHELYFYLLAEERRQFCVVFVEKDTRPLIASVS